MVEDHFDNPDAIRKRFRTELGRMVGRQGIPSPNELAQQAKKSKNCVVSTLRDTGKKHDAETVYARARRGVVIMGGISRRKGGRGWRMACAGGFVIHRDGVIVSNVHVLDAFRKTEAIGVMTDDGQVFPIQSVLAADRYNDVAVLKVETDNLTPLPIAPSVPVGATIYCLSHPALNSVGTKNAFFTFTNGIVSGTFDLRFGKKPPLRVLAVTAAYATGSSGGPILNAHGAVVGMACETLEIADQDAGCQLIWRFARPASSILPLLRGERFAR